MSKPAGVDLSGKVAIVTGAASPGGVGAETARALAQAGAAVIVADLGGTQLEPTAAALAAEGLNVVSMVADIGDEKGIERLIAFSRQKFGRLDILDNNAASQGQPEDRLVGAMDADLWDKIMRVNARGTMLMCKHALPLMIAGGGGSIINISSGTSMAGDMFATAYACSKGAINTLTRYIATQYGAQGIRCNALILGLIGTPILEASLPPPIREVFRQNKLVQRLGRPLDIARMVAFLASEHSSFITGQLLPIDGGFFAHTPTTVAVSELIARMQPPKAS
jgi:NAD(P)-dependent dehydrogenase (short-subunit alcohol dehydrogenase family)